MEAIGGVILLVVIIVAVVLWNRAKDAAAKKINQKVIFRGSHRDGQDIVHRRLDYASAASPESIIAAMRTNLGIPVGVQSAVLGRVLISAVEDDYVSFTSGSRIGSSFRSAITVLPGEHGSVGSYRVLQWTESDGIVSDIDQMTIIETTVREQLVAIDADVTLSVERDAASSE